MALKRKNKLAAKEKNLIHRKGEASIYNRASTSLAIMSFIHLKISCQRGENDSLYHHSCAI